MPLYEVICTHCGEQELFSHKTVSFEVGFCPKCSRAAPRNFGERKGMDPFKSYWTDALSTGSDRPIFINSREQERELCKRFGCVRVS